MLRPTSAVAMALMLGGCSAARGTYYLVEAEQQLQAIRETGAPQHAVYHWTMATAHMEKAYEEWGYSDFGAAERLSGEAVDWARKAEELARQQSTVPTGAPTPTVEINTDRGEAPASDEPPEEPAEGGE